jgi:hypothetical protein
MSDEMPKHLEEPDEDLKRLYEWLCQKPPGSCIGVYEQIPIFEVEDIQSASRH